MSNSNNISSMFAAIKDSLNKPQDYNFKDILKFEVGKTYLVRLLPNFKAPEQTFFHYFHYSWKSFSTGQFVSYVSPTTWGERCPIAEESYKIYKNGSPEEKERGKAIYRKENWLVNVYVVSDPSNPENEGKVKIMRTGAQLQKIIRNAIDGDDAAEFGDKVFKLSAEGCNFRIKCEKKSDKPGSPEFVEYTASKFLNSSKIEGLDEKKIEEIYNGVFDLTLIFPTKTFEELKNGLDEHYYGKTKEEVLSNPVKSAEKSLETDDVPYTEPAKTVVVTKVEETKSVQPEVKPIPPVVSTTAEKKQEVSIDDLLKGLDSLGS